jgi:hypothetical protein
MPGTILDEVTNRGPAYHGRHRPADGQPQEPALAEAVTVQCGDYPTASYLFLVPARRRKRLIVGIGTAFLVLFAVAVVVVFSRDSGKSDESEARPAEVKASTDATAPPDPLSPPAATPTTAVPVAPRSAASTSRAAPGRTGRPGPAAKHDIHPGAPCSPAGATALAANGKLVRCGSSPTDSLNRWRVA